MTAVCVVLVVLLVACWRALLEKDDAYQKEWRAHMETCREVGRLMARAETAEKRLSDNPAGSNYAKLLGRLRGWALAGKISHEEADEIREWLK